MSGKLLFLSGVKAEILDFKSAIPNRKKSATANLICSPYKHNRFTSRFQDIIDSTVLACQMVEPDCMFRRRGGRVKP
jgi:hypothetical protein